nr:deoxyribodipyrimidine photo-lyase [Pelobacter propionicus]
MDIRRIHPLNRREGQDGPVVYWMSRDQRAMDNWALLHAQELALERRAPLVVLFTLAPSFLGATLRQYGFMLRGLAETAQLLAKMNIPFYLLRGEPVGQLCSFVERNRVGTVVTDFDPLRVKRVWREGAARLCGVPFFEVDSHNIVPCRFVSDKQEYGAHTLRPKLRRLLADFLHEFPPLIPHPHAWPVPFQPLDPQGILSDLYMDRSVSELSNPLPGTRAAGERLRSFIAQGLEDYGLRRNDPCCDGQSELSPWLHFGQLAPQRVALETVRTLSGSPSSEAFLDELIVRRELSDNFCLHNQAYDRLEGFPAWALKTLGEHRHDRREYLYTQEQFQDAETHDPLWNAAQRSLLLGGKMHGYLRMYWAKKILEWSASPEEALAVAIRLNDRYSLDGRDPNGYAGIAWSMGGVHDRAWGERPVFGKIRYMNDRGCRRKFDVDAYIRRWGE